LKRKKRKMLYSLMLLLIALTLSAAFGKTKQIEI